MKENALDVLQKRGYIEWCSNPEGLREVFENEMVTAYVGFDPTASSLHVGHLIPIMGLAWLQRLGHRPICLAGGGTGMIGDPSFKSKERVLLTLEVIEKNITGVKKQFEHFMNFHGGPNSAMILNNYTWLNSMTFLEFLRDVGKHFTINYMIAKEHVRSRLNDPEKSISFTEFSYSLLQAYDFYHLYKEFGCRLQMGGNDQQGNIVSGIELARRKEGVEVFGGTNPLLLTSSGTKFGKTEEGAVWLDPELTSPYRFYQFWINTEDEQIEKLLKLFTFLDLDKIDEIMQEHFASPEKRQAQKTLAWEVTSIVHGASAAKTAQR
ncbi:MAG: tyrosine--tRNA ligase, partial [Synergistales bacterium]|nr:tyrosine--tRNA ligase [Synergistales bacterium]